MPMSKGSGVLPSEPDAVMAAAREIGFPVLVKPAGGGGGFGMLPARNETELLSAVERSRSLASRGFGNAEVYLERLIERPRHVEFQVLGDRHGAAAHLFERDCSTQRRNQKVIEEAPAPGIARPELDAMAEKVATMVRGMGYDNIGTVEMLYGADGSFSFLEMNTRLQVEHGVTEAVTGTDLVHAQIRSADGEQLSAILPQKIGITGHAIQARVYAEDPKNFFPSPGRLKVFRLPEEPAIRVETGYAEGRDVTPYYDPMIAKVIVHDATRERAIDRLIEALKAIDIQGIKHNLPAVISVLDSSAFRDGEVHTGIIQQVMAQKKAA
jgi:acetyl-CoA carboxylase biotin carboxylase subunit